MKIYSFDDVKNKSDNTIYNDNIIICDDYRCSLLNAIPVIHKHDFYEIQYTFNGTGSSIYNKTTYNLAHGSIIVCRPEDKHTYFSTDNLAIANLCILPNHSQKQILDNLQTFFFQLDKDSQFEFETLWYLLSLSLRKKHRISNTKTTLYCDMLLNSLVEADNNNNNNNNNSYNIWYDLLYYISQNLSTITTKQAIKMCNMSESSFFRKFKKDFGITFNQYLDSVRIERAKDFLATSDMDINRISDEVGFSHSSRFYRFFKEHEKMTPKEYRKLSHEKAIQK